MTRPFRFRNRVGFFSARRRLDLFLILAGLSFPIFAARSEAASHSTNANDQPPLIQREFRGVWIATKANIDWPSKPGLPVPQQKAELIKILDLASRLRLNAVIFQVRPAGDAFYASSLEPWSEYLTGTMGKPPAPFYDPLAFAVEEAHRRGLELHAWFNPFRARHPSASGPVSSRHISKTQPALVRTYGRHLWLDPGEPGVHEHSLKVILDVVRRYDVDGVHLDDYFYPYPERDAAGQLLDFPDQASWQRYVRGGGKLAKADWRRDNVNRFIQRLYQEVKREKRWVKVGLSPFGIWRPGYPASVRGLDAYDLLYADARRWLASGWLDYLSPQLYWRTDEPQQSYPVLLKWWTEQNTLRRHLWPGNSVYRAIVKPGELAAQIQLTRLASGAGGNVLWSMKTLMEGQRQNGGALLRDIYRQGALVPATPWLDAQPPVLPKLHATPGANGCKISWRAGGGERPWLWILQTREGPTWTTRILPGARDDLFLPGTGVRPAVIALRAVDRSGNLSAPAVLQRPSK
jgi:uncharacterized lipoprotein YddW (UPF0748 family)